MGAVPKYSENKEKLQKDLRSLRCRERALLIEIQESKADVDNYVRKIGFIEADIRDKDRELALLQRKQISAEIELDRRYVVCKGIKVSEHSILQYIRRILHVNTDDIIEEMLSNELIGEHINTVGDGKFPINSKTTGVVVHNTLVTVFSNKQEKENEDDSRSKERLLGREVGDGIKGT